MVNKKQTSDTKAAKTSKSSSVVSKKVKTEVKEQLKTAVNAKVENLFKDYYQRDGRIFLTMPKTHGELPDLLELQKKGYDDFINIYLNKLFTDIEKIWDIAGEKMYITISDVKVSEPIETVDVCKKKELTYGGIITAKVKLVEKVEEEGGKKSAEKVLFNKRANIGILPLMTPSASYIINGVERVIISQIIRSYGIFYGKKDFWYSFKLIPENGPWLEVSVEKTGNVVARIKKSRKFPIT